jgi:hypothetical protein
MFELQFQARCVPLSPEAKAVEKGILRNEVNPWLAAIRQLGLYLSKDSPRVWNRQSIIDWNRTYLDGFIEWIVHLICFDIHSNRRLIHSVCYLGFH